MRILAISGSLRDGSLNTRLLREIAKRAPARVEVDLWDGLRRIPPYDGDRDIAPAPEAVRELREAIAAADGLLFATPEYNSSIPGVLKNAVDWASRPLKSTPFRGKPAAVVGASTGQFGAVWAQAELRKVLRSTGARVLDLDLPVGKADRELADRGSLLANDLRDRRAGEILEGLVAEIERDREVSVAA
ncbi:MAG: NAD(P)H-dependent oxidoreductase [Actinomycetota bacterium]|nr:NAD(P)H-dependent oxidoreductase [Actinomycetota bacterium]